MTSEVMTRMTTAVTLGEARPAFGRVLNARE